MIKIDEKASRSTNSNRRLVWDTSGGYFFLNPPDTQSCTRHSLRRSSVTLLANTKLNIATVKRHGGWKSPTVAEGFIRDSISNKIEIAKKTQGSVQQTSNYSLSSTSSDQMGEYISVCDALHIPCSINITSNKLNYAGSSKKRFLSTSILI